MLGFIIYIVCLLVFLGWLYSFLMKATKNMITKKLKEVGIIAGPGNFRSAKNLLLSELIIFFIVACLIYWSLIL